MPQRLSIKSWLLEILLAVLAMMLGLFFVANAVSEGDSAPLAVEAVAAVVSFTGLVLFRRSHPVALTLFLIPCGILLGMPMGATPVALFAVALHRPARVVITLAAVHAAATAVIYGLVLGLTSEYYESVAFLVLLHVSLVAVALVIRSRRQLVASWAERVRQAEEGQRLRIEQARLAEREQIAREMHDALAHRISLLALHAGALSVRRDASADERQAAGVIRQCAHDALEDLRTLLGMLRGPAVDRPLPTLGDVPALVELSREAGAEVSLLLTGRDDDSEVVPDQIGRHAYRIVQEALTNALKHAPGSPVRVNVDVRYLEGLSVHVVNDLGWHHPGAAGGPAERAGGRPDVVFPRWPTAESIMAGAAADTRASKGTGRAAGSESRDMALAAAIPGAGAGLTGLRERVQLVGGHIEHGPTAAGEFDVTAWLPWHT
ncbi:sensor histidine kinase [Paractinoplanes durhamensis]|uniref:histidine kinase n=1 Tax=Paractinoplanes durhamensis TaxID=113563 RepID=A0ABQ3YX25_9ACTN|nr:histidine kinase [Actinoplanes durhamensis]GIE02142.1 two-component sensor histidine kinase [Actinoplanes durhamensis]